MAETGLEYRLATRDDLLGAARVYLRAFPESLEDLHAPNLKPVAIADLLLPAIVSEPDSLFVAVDRSAPEAPRVVGYCLAPRNVAGIGKAAFWRGILFRWVWRFLTRQYGLGWGSMVATLHDKISFRRTDQTPEADCPSRILSIAVDPDSQGHGIGGSLLTMALARFRKLGVSCVRLEVRPDNTPAKSLYLKVGFRGVGQFRDTRGAWDIMMLDLASPEGDAPAN